MYIETRISDRFQIPFEEVANPPDGTLRYSVTESSPEGCTTVRNVVVDAVSNPSHTFYKRSLENHNTFNAILIIPTGIGCRVGGHAGDAGPVAKLLAGVCDRLIVHPNVVNASDINEMSDNCWYVEGSTITRLLLGQVCLFSQRRNRVLVLIEPHNSETVGWSINAVNAARASYGLTADVYVLGFPIALAADTCDVAGGNTGKLFEVMRAASQSDYDAIAITSPIMLMNGWENVAPTYFRDGGVNPWGGIEAALTHAMSWILNKPVAHAPMAWSKEASNYDTGVVDPRMAAECVSVAYLNCVLKGLMQSPRIRSRTVDHFNMGGFGAEDVDCIVIPEGCLGPPTIAAHRQGIPIIVVRGNANVLKNDLSLFLDHKPGAFYYVENYAEAAGVLQAMKLGMDPLAIGRPFPPVVRHGTAATIMEQQLQMEKV